MQSIFLDRASSKSFCVSRDLFSPNPVVAIHHWNVSFGMGCMAFCANLWDSFWSSYERLVIVASESICIKDYWSGWYEYLSSGKQFDGGSFILAKVIR